MEISQLESILKKDFPIVSDYFKKIFKGDYLSNIANNLEDNSNTLLPFKEMIRTVVEKDKDDLDYELLQKLETNLKILLPIKKAKGLKFDSVYNDLNDLSEDDGFWQKYNELEVFTWFSKYGDIKALEQKNVDNIVNKQTIDLVITVNNRRLYVEILSLSKKEIRLFHDILERELKKTLQSEIDCNFHYSINFNSLFSINSALKKEVREHANKKINDFQVLELCAKYYANILKKELNRNHINTLFKYHIRDAVLKNGKDGFPFPYGTPYKYCKIIVKRDEKSPTSLIPAPNDPKLFKQLEKTIEDKLIGKSTNEKGENDNTDGKGSSKNSNKIYKKGKLPAFPDNEINLFLLYVSRANEFLYSLPFDRADEFSSSMKDFSNVFNNLYIKNDGLKKLSGFILMFPKFGRWKGETVFFRNSNTEREIPLDIINKLLNDNMTSYTIVNKENIYVNRSFKENLK